MFSIFGSLSLSPMDERLKSHNAGNSVCVGFENRVFVNNSFQTNLNMSNLFLFFQKPNTTSCSLVYKIQRCLKSKCLVLTAPNIHCRGISWHFQTTHTHVRYVSPRLVWSCLAVDRMLRCRRPWYPIGPGKTHWNAHMRTQKHIHAYYVLALGGLFMAHLSFLSSLHQCKDRDLTVSPPLFHSQCSFFSSSTLSVPLIY